MVLYEGPIYITIPILVAVSLAMSIVISLFLGVASAFRNRGFVDGFVDWFGSIFGLIFALSLVEYLFWGWTRADAKDWAAIIASIVGIVGGIIAIFFKISRSKSAPD